VSLNMTIFGRNHYLNRAFPYEGRRTWFYPPDEHSTGGTGFCIWLGFIGLHMCFMWGER